MKLPTMVIGLFLFRLLNRYFFLLSCLYPPIRIDKYNEKLKDKFMAHRISKTDVLQITPRDSKGKIIFVKTIDGISNLSQVVDLLNSENIQATSFSFRNKTKGWSRRYSMNGVAL